VSQIKVKDEPITIEVEPVVEGQIVVREETAVVPVSEGAALRTAILELARDPNFDVEKLRTLNELQERVETRQARRSFNEAFSRLQSRLPAVKRDGRLEYPKDKNKPDGEKQLIAKYPKWEDILEAIQPILAEEGFALTFGMEPRADGGGLLVHGILIHGAHEHHGPAVPVPLDTSGGKNNAQSYGSTTSYGQRYATKALLNLRWEGEDDDGVAGGREFIRADQIAQISALINETETDPVQFLRWVFSDEGSHNFSEIQQGDQFSAAVNALMAKKRRKTPAP
jgi:hypothetical protein